MLFTAERKTEASAVPLLISAKDSLLVKRNNPSGSSVEFAIALNPSPRVVEAIAKQPIGSVIGIGVPSPAQIESFNNGPYEGFTFMQESAAYWNTIRAVCRTYGHKVVSLDNMDVHSSAETILRFMRLEKPDGGYDPDRAYYGMDVKLNHLLRVTREERIMQKVEELRPKVVLVDQTFGDTMWLESRSKGRNFGTYWVEGNAAPLDSQNTLIGRAIYNYVCNPNIFQHSATHKILSENLPQNFVNTAPVVDPSNNRHLAEKRGIVRRLNTLKFKRVTDWETSRPVLVGKWKGDDSGIFEIRFDQGGRSGSIEEVRGSAAFTTSSRWVPGMSQEIHMRIKYDRNSEYLGCPTRPIDCFGYRNSDGTIDGLIHSTIASVDHGESVSVMKGGFVMVEPENRRRLSSILRPTGGPKETG